MQEEALKLLQETAIAAVRARSIELDGRQLYIAADGEVIDLEQYGELRSRFRGTFSTNSIPDFVTHVKKQNDISNHVFIDAETFTAEAIYNYGDNLEPGHCDDTAVLGLKKTPEFEAVLGINGCRVDQLRMVDFIEDWHKNLIALKHGVYMSLSSAIAAVRKITVKSLGDHTHEVNNFGASKSALEEIDAGTATLPETFEFKCTPYAGLPEHTFILRFGVLTGGEKPLCVLRIVQKEVALEQITQSFKNLLTDEIGDAATVYIGTFQK